MNGGCRDVPARRVELNLSRFTLLETDRLTSDLTRLLQAQQTDVARCGSRSSLDTSGTTAEFSGIILLYDHRPCAAIGYSRETPATIGISEPIVLQEATDELYRALFGQLIRAVKRRAVSEGARRLQVLLPASAEAMVSEEFLTEHSLVYATDILQWDLSVLADDRFPLPDRCTFQRCDFSANNAAAVPQIQSALDEVLECSEDLNRQPKPTAAELLKRWHHMQAQVFVCRMEETIAGLISFVANQNLSTAATVSGTTSASDSNFCIEYVGVVPAFRRRHIATLLLRQIPKLVASIHDPQDRRSERRKSCPTPDGQDRIQLQTLRLSAFSDASNTPANSLYLQCGFVQTNNRRLWCCDLTGET